jgi:hypothetical protein
MAVERVEIQPNPALFPVWAIKKIGIPILTEADFAGAMPNAKYGLFASTTGTLAQDTANLRVGGAGSCKMLTAATNADTTEIKYNHHYINPKGWLIALEMKWAQAFAFGATKFDIGIENRDTTNIKHIRFRYTVTSAKWQYEDTDLSYKDFPGATGGALAVEKPVISATAGTRWGWARCIIDPTNNKYVGFEASGPLGIESRDMRAMNLACVPEGASTANDLLFFALVTAGGAGAEAGYVTDWVISLIPPDLDPYSLN